MKRTPLALGLYLIGIACFAASAATPRVVIVGKSKVVPGKSILIDASKSTADRPLVWSFKGPDVPVVYFAGDEGKGKVFAYVDDPVAGVYEFKVKAKGVPDGQTEIDADVDTWTVVVEDSSPPKPPTPKPDVDPTPGPTPGPAPPPDSLVTDKLRVLMIYESGDPMPPGPYEAFRSPQIRDYLNSHTMAEGGYQAWRFWDKDAKLAGESPGFQAAMKAALADPKPIPKMVAFKDTAILDSIVPTDAASTLEWLRRYGGH